MSTFDVITQRLLEEAGISSGMRVLDIGCGMGVVTRRVAQMVGEHGVVIGVDTDSSSLDLARSQTAEAGIPNIEYVQANLHTYQPDLDSFDAIVGRRVLMYLRTPEEVLQRLISGLRRNGVCAFQEQARNVSSDRIGHWPLHDQLFAWVWETVQREGANPKLGLILPGILRRLGLVVEQIAAAAGVVGFEQGHYPLHSIVESMIPRMLKQQVITAGQIDVQALAQHLQAERESNQSIYASDLTISVIARRSDSL